MSNLNLKAQKENTYDAIVIGSGMSGGWAAKEFCEKGFNTLVLERGRHIQHIKDFPTMNKEPWDYETRGALTFVEEKEHEIQQRSGYVNQNNKHFWVNDTEHPYVEEKPFDWVRGYQTGGKSMLWGRHCYRWSDFDFEANNKEGIGVDWPIRYKDIAPWYDYVEKFVGVSGQKMELPQLPDSQFLKPMDLNCLESHVKEKIEAHYDNRHLTIGRVANLTESIHGRGPCMSRNKCSRGCPFNGYFSSNSVLIPAAEKTGNMTLLNHSIVSEIIYDDKKEKATGVRVINENTNETIEYYANVIFCNASCLGTTAILLNSKSLRFPNGFGNDSGELGHNLMDHHYFVGAVGEFDGLEDKGYSNQRPTGIYIPRFRNLNNTSKAVDFKRGYGYQGSAYRDGWGSGGEMKGFGGKFKENLMEFGPWKMVITGFGEVLPRHENKMYQHATLKDKWGIPQMVFDCEWVENDYNMREQIKKDAVEMFEVAGMKNIQTFDKIGSMGRGIHEMGTARMGNDPKTSLLNKHNQFHAAKNVYVTDGACMTSASCVNPSLTYMALTARAVDHAIKEMKKQNI